MAIFMSKINCSQEMEMLRLLRILWKTLSYNWTKLYINGRTLSKI